MPLFEYKCKKCGHRFEKIEKYTDSSVKKCPKCGAKAERQLAAPAIQFKGSGWYVTDYGGKTGTPPSGESLSDTSSGKSDDKSAESKSSSEKSSDKSSDKGSGKSSEKSSDKGSSKSAEKASSGKKK